MRPGGRGKRQHRSPAARPRGKAALWGGTSGVARRGRGPRGTATRPEDWIPSRTLKRACRGQRGRRSTAGAGVNQTDTGPLRLAGFLANAGPGISLAGSFPCEPYAQRASFSWRAAAWSPPPSPNPPRQGPRNATARPSGPATFRALASIAAACRPTVAVSAAWCRPPAGSGADRAGSVRKCAATGAEAAGWSPRPTASRAPLRRRERPPRLPRARAVR